MLLSTGWLLATLLAGSAVAPELAQAGFVSDAMETIFGVKSNFITGAYFQWIIEAPSVALTSGGDFAKVEGLTRGFALAALAAVLTLALIHYWAAGFFSQGGGVALEGVMRTGGAAVFILAWPWVFDNATALVNVISDSLISQAKLDYLADGLAPTVGALGDDKVSDTVTFFTSGIPLLLAIILSLTFVVVSLAVFVAKLAMSVGLIGIAVGMPLALAVWPVPGLAWLPVFMLKACAGILAAFIAWAVLMAALAETPEMADQVGLLAFQQGERQPALFDQLMPPLLVIGSLGYMVKVPGTMLRASGVTTGGGGFIAHALGFMMSQFAFRGIARHVPDRFGGMKDTLAQQRADRAQRAMDRQDNIDYREWRAQSDLLGKDAALGEKQEAKDYKEWKEQSHLVGKDAALGEKQEAKDYKEWKEQSHLVGKDAALGEKQEGLARQADSDARQEFFDRSRINQAAYGLEKNEVFTSSSSPLAGDGQIGSVERSFGTIRPDLQARVRDIASSPLHANDRRKAFNSLLKQPDLHSIERSALAELRDAHPDALFVGTTPTSATKGGVILPGKI